MMLFQQLFLFLQPFSSALQCPPVEIRKETKGGSLDCNTLGWTATTDGEKHKKVSPSLATEGQEGSIFVVHLYFWQWPYPHLYRFLALESLAFVPLNPRDVGRQPYSCRHKYVHRHSQCQEEDRNPRVSLRLLPVPQQHR